MYDNEIMILNNDIQRLAEVEGFVLDQNDGQKISFLKSYEIDSEINNTISFVLSISQIFEGLGFSDMHWHFSHPGIITALAEKWGFTDKMDIIPKLRGLSENEMIRTLGNAGFSETQIHQIQHLMRLHGSVLEQLDVLDNWFSDYERGRLAITEIRELISALNNHKTEACQIIPDFLNMADINHIDGMVASVTEQISSCKIQAKGGKTYKDDQQNFETYRLEFEISSCVSIV